MNETVSSTTNPDMDQQIAALQRQVLLLLVALIVVTATLTGFLYYESHIGSADLNFNRQRLLQMITQYQTEQPAIQKFETQLVEYGAKNPKFQPILNQYGMGPANSKMPTTPAP